MQFLERHGIRRKLTLAALLGGCAMLAGLALSGDRVVETVLNAKTALVEDIGQSAWRQALANEPRHQAWPWETTSASGATQPTVRQLGFSAVLNDAPLNAANMARLTRDDARHMVPLPAVATGSPMNGKTEDLSVGDRITVVTPDGLSHLYQVTARETGPDGKAKTKATGANTQTASTGSTEQNCSPLDRFIAGAKRLVIEAVQSEPAHRTPQTTEQKL